MWPYLLKTKDEALERFKNFKAMVENKYGRRIKVLRTDRESRITRQLTAPYTPQQNGIVERRNRTVMSTTRSILNAMSMPQVFRAEAVRHAVYVLNRLPTKILKDQTPYEALKGTKPRVDHLRVFGCVGFVKTPSQLTKKLDDRSVAMVHLGIEPGRKAYRMYDVEGEKVVISRDVVFNEAQGWSWTKDQSQGQIKEANFVLHINPHEEGSSSQSVEDHEPSSPESPHINSRA
ncbi:hypothetical protein E3N88_16674 [Mikania micrantha]|uniref:Integrase catalytic domain-containing protein n=1 Tax=Mikania micrantha TaxID=192012 RepID=A0A5N6NZ28_9ASTR|nr:hypothetical protein E3N88_16674 [Mikania micrantha]